jgi:hypothetical protein
MDTPAARKKKVDALADGEFFVEPIGAVDKTGECDLELCWVSHTGDRTSVRMRGIPAATRDAMVKAGYKEAKA